MFVVSLFLIFSIGDNITGEVTSIDDEQGAKYCLPVCIQKVTAETKPSTSVEGILFNCCITRCNGLCSRHTCPICYGIEQKPTTITTQQPTTKVYGSAIYCIDTDLGKDIYKKAGAKRDRVDFENNKEIRRETIEKERTDWCPSSSEVTEFYCEKGRIYESRIKCPSGICKDGACIIKTEETSTVYRTETACVDNTGKYEDRCYLPGPGSIRIIKSYPQNGKCTSVSPIGELCPVGYRCVNNKCIKDMQAGALWAWIIKFGEEYQKASTSYGSVSGGIK